MMIEKIISELEDGVISSHRVMGNIGASIEALENLSQLIRDEQVLLTLKKLRVAEKYFQQHISNRTIMTSV